MSYSMFICEVQLSDGTWEWREEFPTMEEAHSWFDNRCLPSKKVSSVRIVERITTVTRVVKSTMRYLGVSDEEILASIERGGPL